MLMVFYLDLILTSSILFSINLMNNAPVCD
jgi:hypothetical protein